MPRFAPCGREFRREAEGFRQGPRERCREPRMCPHCELIETLREELYRLNKGQGVTITIADPNTMDERPPEIVDAEIVTDETPND